MKRDGLVLLERRRISRDLHDSSIQPYLGLKWALEVIQTKAATGHAVTEDLSRLVERVDHEILAMRSYVNALREVPARRKIELPGALRIQLVRWSDLYDLKVFLRATGAIRMVSEHLASAVLNIANEGLSNIRRHTVASRARILLSCGADQIRVVIVNPIAPDAVPTLFKPQSIDERARALGGNCRVDCAGWRETRVVVELPRSSE
jgi:signal transduction histidine kinase